MKIEKINPNQVKCTLDKEDLSLRGIRISELAYGSDNLKLLYDEVMRQAFTELGFEPEEYPVMIEAIPIATGSLVLLVTKVEEPEELDTRFSRFSPESEGTISSSDSLKEVSEFNILPPGEDPSEKVSPSFTSLPDLLRNASEEGGTKPLKHPLSTGGTVKIYSFFSLGEITELAKNIVSFFRGESAVYKDVENGKYFLILQRVESDKEMFGKVCNFISEYSAPVKGNYATLSYVREHFEPIILADAVTILSAL